MPIFNVNINRHDPYKTYRFLIYFGTSTSPVAAVSKISKLQCSNDVIEYKAGGDLISRKGIGRPKFEAVTLERGITHDPEFEKWANYAVVLSSGLPSMSLKNLRQDIRLDMLNEAGQPVYRYRIYRCWPSEYQALPDLDAGANAIAIEHLKLENEGWERDLSLTEPTEN